jgi:hypothetical protein
VIQFGNAALALALGVCACESLRRSRPGARLWAGLAVGILSLVPLGGLSLAAAARGLVGELSVTSIALLAFRIARLAGSPELARRENSALLGSVLASGAALYPMSLGLASFDPYALGFGRGVLLYALFALALAGVLFGLELLPVVLAGAMGAFALEILESSNLWDYWIDPWVFCFALLGAGRRITVFVSRSKSK